MVYQLFRRHQQAVMILITLITILSFAGFYTHSDFLERGASGRVATIYGRSLSLAQAQRIGRKADLSQQLGMQELYVSLAVTQQDARKNFIFNSIVLKHEAERLGIEPTEDEIFQAMSALPYFQTNGVYDSRKYATITELLFPRGFTPDDLGDLIADDVRLKKIKALLGTTVAPSESEIHDEFTRIYQKTEASVVRFKLDDFLASTQVPEEDVKKLYEERKASLHTEETRKVKYVAFVLPATDKPLTGKDRAAALTDLQKKAEDFAVAMADKNAKFDEAAAKAGVKVEESPEFSETQPPEGLGRSREVAAAAFKLTKEDPNSDAIDPGRGGSGYYVLQLENITPPRPLTFEEARANLTDTLKHERAQEALNLKAADVRNKIEADLKAGKNFVEAAKAAGVKVEDFPAFSLKDQKNNQPDAGEIMQTASELNVGQLSTTMPTADGSVMVYVARRLPIDESEFKANKAETAEHLEEAQRIALFQEWLKLRRAAAQVKENYGST